MQFALVKIMKKQLLATPTTGLKKMTQKLGHSKNNFKAHKKNEETDHPPFLNLPTQENFFKIPLKAV